MGERDRNPRAQGQRRRLKFCEFAGEFIATPDAQFLEHMREMCLHRPLCDEQPLGGLTVRPTLGRQSGDADFARRQRFDAREHGPAGPPARGDELIAGPPRERGCTGAMCELEAPPERVAGLHCMAVPADGCTQFDQCPGKIEPSRGLLEQFHRRAQERQAGRPRRYDAGDPGRCSDYPRQPGRPCQLELLGRQASSLVFFADLCEGKRRVLAPPCDPCVAAPQMVPTAPGLEQVGDSLTHPALRDAQTTASLNQERPGEHLGLSRLVGGHLRKCCVGARQVAQLGEAIDEARQGPRRALFRTHGHLLLERPSGLGLRVAQHAPAQEGERSRKANVATVLTAPRR